MSLFAGLVAILVPLFKLFSGVAALVIIYAILMSQVYPLFQVAQTKLLTAISGSASCSNFCDAVLFFDISRAITVLLAAMLAALAWKAFLLAAKTIAARAGA